MAEREKELKSLLMKVKEEREKASLKLNIQMIQATLYSAVTRETLIQNQPAKLHPNFCL